MSMTSGRSGPLRGPDGTPVNRLPTVVEEFELDRKNRQLHERIPRSARYFRTARSPLVALLLLVLATALLSYVVYGRDASGSTKQASRQLKAAEHMSRTAIMAVPPASVVRGSPLACWASNEQVMTNADLRFEDTGKRASTLEQIDVFAEENGRDLRLPESTLENAPTFSRTCGLEAASALADGAQDHYASARFETNLALASMFLVWLAVVMWCMRALENLRRSAGRTVNTSIAVLAWIPVWLAPFIMAAMVDGLDRELWFFRVVFGGAIILTIIYYSLIRGRMSWDIWKATGLDAPALSVMFWVPELIGVVALMASPLWMSFNTVPTVEGRVIEYDALSDVLQGTGFIWMAIAVVTAYIYMIVITVAQTIGLDQAMKGREAPIE